MFHSQIADSHFMTRNIQRISVFVSCFFKIKTKIFKERSHVSFTNRWTFTLLLESRWMSQNRRVLASTRRSEIDFLFIIVNERESRHLLIFLNCLKHQRWHIESTSSHVRVCYVLNRFECTITHEKAQHIWISIVSLRVSHIDCVLLAFAKHVLFIVSQ